MRYKLLLLFLTISTTLLSQTDRRLEIKGEIVAKTNEVEGVTIFNQSSNKGTITNQKGEFKIKVKLNDMIEISALQFKPIKVKIDEEMIKNESIKVLLVEEVNTLDEVVILPYGLTGSLKTDVQEVKLVEPIVFSFGDFNNYDFSDDHLSSVQNIAINQGQYYNMIDFSKFFKLIFKSKGKKNNLNHLNEETKPKELTDVYTHKYISTAFNIPIERVEAFIVFVEENGLTQELLLEEKEMQLIEFLLKQT